MVLNAVAGAVGFLSRLPIGRADRHWAAFRRTPAAFPLVGYCIGLLVALPLLLPSLLPSLPSPTVAASFVAGVYLLTGITHLDGLADIGDALVVHGGPERRREVMHDAAVGVGGALAVALAILGLGTAGLAIAETGRGVVAVVALVVAAEVGAKAGMALLVCLGSAAHDGLGATLTERSSARSLAPVSVLAAPAAVLAWPAIAGGTAALLAAIAVAVLVLIWARRALGGVSGDVIGATNELARIAALHAGVIAWTLS